jgi:hypothetical protein
MEMKAIALANMTPEERHARIREFKQSLEPFAHMLTHIYTIMPHPGYLIKDDGQFEPLPPQPEWQKKIDEISRERDRYVKENFPEFYTETPSSE